MRKLSLAVLMVLCFSGCNEEVDTGKVTQPIYVIRESLSRAEPVIKALETASGKTLNPVVAARGEAIANKTAEVAQASAGIATILGQPGITALCTALALTAGGIGSFFHRRRAAALAKTASRAADKVVGGGKILMAEAAKLGVADVVSKAYEERK